MGLYFLVLMQTCGLPILENRTPHPFNEKDLKHFKVAQLRCGEIYKESPCVKRFIKRTPNDYSVVCGK